MKKLLSLQLLIFVLCAALPSITLALTGKVVSITDGDTITILSDKTQHKIRLYGIDTPEKGQPFGNAAKKHTSMLVAGKTVDVTSYDTDKYGRTVGVVRVDGINVNQSLISAGYAWQYRKYCKASFCENWLELEEKTRLSGIGLWADNDPVPPWQWRKGARNNSHSNTTTSQDIGVGVYHGNIKSHVFHSSSCHNYNCKNCTQTFASREDALSSGYRPCGQCKP